MLALVAGNNFGTRNMLIIILITYFSNSHGKSAVLSLCGKNVKLSIQVLYKHVY